MELCVQGKTRHLLRGDAFCIPPLMTHSICASGPYSLLVLCVDKSLANPRLSDTTIKRCEALLAEALEGSGLGGATMHQLVSLLRQVALDPVESNPTIEQLLARISRSPEESLSLDAMGVISGYSKYHLIRKFQVETGLTPHRLLAQCRVRKAQGLLNAGQPPGQVWAACGYYDQSHFIREFERLVGLSPTAFRASLTK